MKRNDTQGLLDLRKEFLLCTEVLLRLGNCGTEGQEPFKNTENLKEASPENK
jgi:hypothetical protein